MLDEPGRPDLYNQWADFYFPGRDKYIFWNATIITAARAFWDAAHGIAFDRAYAMLTPEESNAEFHMEFEPADISKTGKILTYRLVERPKTRFDKFDGLTFDEYLEKLEAETILETPPLIHESFQLKNRYAYGLGLSIVVDATVIKREAIETAINNFRKIGETNWQAINPVPRELLPVISEKAALMAIKEINTGYK